jgi:hypothetical protein
MSAPTLQVLVGFQTTVNFGAPFQLNNATYGLLGTGTLGGYQMVDLTSQCLSVNVTRGRNRELEQYNAGTALVAFRDPQRILDPLNASSPYYPYVGPRSPIQIIAAGLPIYTGFVADWELSYDYVTAGNITTARCADAFTVLANQNMNEWTPTAQTSGLRVAAVLQRPEVLYQGPQVIDAGQSTLGNYLVTAGTNVLNYLQLVSASEQGYLFIDSAGVLTFRDRASVYDPLPDTYFTDDGTGIPYSKLTNSFGDELLYNYIQTQSPGAMPPPATPAVASDANSIALYMAQQYTKLDLLNSTSAEVTALGNYLLGRYKDPVLRFTGLEVQLAALSTKDQAGVLSADLSDIASVQKSFTVGTPASVTQTVIVSGVTHTIRPGSHTVRLTFESTDQAQYLTLDSTVFGYLDSNLLAF